MNPEKLAGMPFAHLEALDDVTDGAATILRLQ
jgi:hypothetical protein